MDSGVINWTCDVAIVGTGMGGATLGYALAQAGLKVIFLEKGYRDFSQADDRYAAASDDPEVRLRNGVWPTRISGATDAVRSSFFPPLGCGVGGSSLLYAAALERFRPTDFLPDSEAEPLGSPWPVSFEEILPYYRLAETLYRVRGGSDPLYPESSCSLASPPPLSESDAHFFESFQSAGLHPYRLPVGIAFDRNCEECLGYICPRQCKNDARVRCLEPALQTGNAVLLDRCEVERLDADSNSVRAVVGSREGSPIRIRARIVVLAAGAYFSPTLLLKSANEFWPDGLANESGLVGRNLMFHVSDLIALWPRHRLSRIAPHKALALTDFYRLGGKHYGSFQSTGLTAGYGNIMYFLKSQFDRSHLRWCKPIRPLLSIPAYLGALLFGHATIFATIMEDMPYPDNRVLLDSAEPNGMRFEYTVRTELRERNRRFRQSIRQMIKPHRAMFLNHDLMLNYGHPCGTCRFGQDPRTSVLDRNNKAHRVDNLYVVDASFMPSSGGVNPALTIAANALRVADQLLQNLRSKATAEAWAC